MYLRNIAVPVLITIAALVFAMGAVVALHADRIGLTPRARIAIVLLVAALLAIELAYVVAP
jgi:hypothetical protein